MSDEGQPLKAEHIFKKIVWRNTLSLSDTMERATTWSITGTAAIVGLLISNLDAVSTLVSAKGLKWSISLLTASLVFGAISKQIGMAIAKGLELIKEIERILGSAEGELLLAEIRTPIKQLIEEIASAFYWPLSSLWRKSGMQGLTDYLAADKRFIKLFCFQLGFIYLHAACAAAALIVIAVSIVG